jgi:hypothetical protein
MNCFLTGKFDSGKTMNRFNKKPIQKVIGKTKNKEAMCGLKTTIDKSTFCFTKTK